MFLNPKSCANMSKASRVKGDSGEDRHIQVQSVVLESKLNWNENISIMSQKRQLADILSEES